ncbi:MAG: hypothetical protein U5K75_09030 [Ahrensia sp.]|nr:hypothetical protein [Ahrensia sp.]
MTKQIRIDRLLEWAYVEELPKLQKEAGRFDCGFSKGGFWDRFAELGTMIDAQTNDYGVVPDIGFDGAPHPDAIAVHDAVGQLAGNSCPAHLLADDWPQEVRDLIDWSISVDSVRSLVITAAILRRPPQWVAAPAPRRSMVMKDGRPAWFLREVHVCQWTGKQSTIDREGYNSKSGRPFAGAVRKYELDKSARLILNDRADWFFWREALSELVQCLNGTLKEHIALEFDHFSKKNTQSSPHLLACGTNLT